MMNFECTALIGHTGFVGSNLLRQRAFDATFNSSTINDMRGRAFDLVVCAGARAEKWKANADPARDLDNIESLIRAFESADIGKLVLVSTVDVFPDPAGVDEDTVVHARDAQPYGRNRRRLEQIAEGRFDSLVVRLPGLYGPGLKKNVIYDFLNDNQTEKIDSRGCFQFYDVGRLWSDIEVALDNELPLVHLPTEPVSVADVAREAFGIEFKHEIVPKPARYDVHTKYASLFGGSGAYVESRARELAGIAAFVREARATA